MKNRRKEAERLADELMMAYGKALGEAREKYCEALMNPDQPDPPMFIDEEQERLLRELRLESDWEDDWDEALDGADNWMDAWDDWDHSSDNRETVVPMTPKRRSRRHMIRRAVILAATLILVMAIALVAAEGVKLKKSTLYMKPDSGESTRIVDISKAEFDVEDFVVTYVPEGYELVEDVMVNEFVRMIYYHSDTTAGITIHIIKTEQFGANVDNESVSREEVLVNDKQAYLFDNRISKMIVWQMGDCTVSVSARLSEEELQSIGCSIFVK